METNPDNNNQQQIGDKERLSALEDNSLLDIATGPEYSAKDSLDAQATIAERQRSGVFDEDAEQTISTEDDLLKHNYGVMDGNIIAPPEGYRNEKTDDGRQHNIGHAALDGYSEELYDDGPARTMPTKMKLHPHRDDSANPHYEHKAEMKEAERSKFNERAILEDTEKYREFKQYAPENWKYRGKKYEKNHYYLPTKHDRLLDREATKEGEERRDWLIQLDGESVSPEQRINSAIEYAKWRLSKDSAVKQMYAEGALEGISEGDFSLNPNFIYDGLKSLHGREIDRRASSSRELVWDSIRFGGMLPRIEDPEQLIDLEKNAIGTAIELGVVETYNGQLGKRTFKIALPIEKLGDDKIARILASYDLISHGTEADLSKDQNSEREEQNSELYEKFESGFVNIIDALKEDQKSEKGFRELDWYFENMLQENVEEEIADRVINVYEAGESELFVEKFNQFMRWREQKEVAAGKKASRDNDINQLDKEIIAITEEGIDITDAPEEAIFPQVDSGHDRHPDKGKAWKHPVGYGVRKYRAFNSHLEQIEEVPGFQKHSTYKKKSKPIYLRNVYRKEMDDEGRTRSVLDHVEPIPAHYDPERKVYVSERTNRVIDEKNIRRYISAYFSINGIDVTIKEGITNMSSSLYVVVGNKELTLEPNSPLFHGTMQETKDKVQQSNGVVFKKNHCSYTKDGIKGYHGYEKMWEETIKEILKAVKKMGEANQAV